jgi:hypothetical protein
MDNYGGVYNGVSKETPITYGNENVPLSVGPGSSLLGSLLG